MKIDIFEAFKIISNPVGEGIPYICRQALGTDKGNAVAPIVLSLISSSQNRTLEEVTALASAVTAEENAPEATA